MTEGHDVAGLYDRRFQFYIERNRWYARFVDINNIYIHTSSSSSSSSLTTIPKRYWHTVRSEVDIGHKQHFEKHFCPELVLPLYMKFTFSKCS